MGKTCACSWEGLTCVADKFEAIPASRDYVPFVTFVFFAAITVLFTFPVIEGDFFWHVKTGQWIWEHKSLPSSDPFSYTINYVNQTGYAAQRIQFLLKQYWLGQLALFGTWKASGEAGMVVLRASIYTSILLFQYWWLKRCKSGIIPLATVFMVGNVLRNYPNERPQLFAFAFMVVMLYLLERLNDPNKTSLKYHLAGLLLLMLVWSNCHGSFILGVVVIAMYLICHIFLSRLQNNPLDKSFIAVMAGAMLITLANPNGSAAFVLFFNTKKSYLDCVTENISPFTLAIDHHTFDYFYWLLLFILFITIVLKFRYISLHHIIITVSLAALSLTGVRYIPFLALAMPLIASDLPDWKPKGKYALIPLAVLLIWLGTADYRNVFKFRATKEFPSQAVKFLNTVKLGGNIFNEDYWGGYLMCYTNYPVFIDGRALAENLLLIHNNVLDGKNWKGPLSYFRVNSIIIPGTDIKYGRAYPLLLQIRQDNEWALVYQDDVALVFLRNIPQNQEIISRYAISKDNISKHIMARWAWQFNEM